MITITTIIIQNVLMSKKNRYAYFFNIITFTKNEILDDIKSITGPLLRKNIIHHNCSPNMIVDDYYREANFLAQT